MPEVKVHPTDGAKPTPKRQLSQRQKNVMGAMGMMIINSINPRLKNYSKPILVATIISFLTLIGSVAVFATQWLYEKHFACVRTVRFMQNFGDTPSQWRFAQNALCENSPNKDVSKGCSSSICISDMKKVFQWGRSQADYKVFIAGEETTCPDPTTLEHFPEPTLEGFPIGTKACTPHPSMLGGITPEIFMGEQYEGPPGVKLELCTGEGVVNEALVEAVKQEAAAEANELQQLEAQIVNNEVTQADINWACPILNCFGGCYTIGASGSGECVQGALEKPMDAGWCSELRSEGQGLFCEVSNSMCPYLQCPDGCFYNGQCYYTVPSGTPAGEALVGQLITSDMCCAVGSTWCDSKDENFKCPATTLPMEEKWVSSSFPEEKWESTPFPEEKWESTPFPEEQWASTSFPEEQWASTSFPDATWEGESATGEKRRLAPSKEDVKKACSRQQCPFPEALVVTEFYYTEERCKVPSIANAVGQAMAFSTYIEFAATALIVVIFLRCKMMTTLKPMRFGDHFSIIAEDENKEMKEFIMADVDPKFEKMQQQLEALQKEMAAMRGTAGPKGGNGTQATVAKVPNGAATNGTPTNGNGQAGGAPAADKAPATAKERQYAPC